MNDATPLYLPRVRCVSSSVSAGIDPHLNIYRGAARALGVEIIAGAIGLNHRSFGFL